MTVPIWLMDFDEVVNIWGYGADRVRRAWGETRSFEALSYTIVVAPELLRRVKDLHESGAVEVRWLTTWEEKANEVLAPELDWPEFKVQGTYATSQLPRARKFSESREAYRELVGWWKLEFAQAAYEEGRPVVWTDDEIATAPGAMNWLRIVDRDRMLAISPTRGLLPVDLDRIELFIKDWNERPLT